MAKIKGTTPAGGDFSNGSAGVAAEEWTHQATFAWLAGHPGWLDGYEEQWVAMVGSQIVGQAPDIVEAVRQAAGFDDPLLVPVPPSGDLIL